MLGIPPPDMFIHVPQGLRKFCFLGRPDLLHGIDGNGDDIIWQGGQVQYFMQDRGVLHPVVSDQAPFYILPDATIVFNKWTKAIHSDHG